VSVLFLKIFAALMELIGVQWSKRNSRPPAGGFSTGMHVPHRADVKWLPREQI
jgi:hypothetical protein